MAISTRAPAGFVTATRVLSDKDVVRRGRSAPAEGGPRSGAFGQSSRTRPSAAAGDRLRLLPPLDRGDWSETRGVGQGRRAGQALERVRQRAQFAALLGLTPRQSSS
jgi:hypothetical protein